MRTLKVDESKLQLVLVEWLDSTTRHDVAVPFEEAIEEEPVEARTTGWLLLKDGHKVVLCNFVFVPQNEGMVNGYKSIHIIPAKSVKKITKLKEVL